VHCFSTTAAASAATAVAEGAAKPESTPAWTEVTATVRKLAHYTRVNDEVLADFDSFRQVIGAEMLTGLIAQENAQLITGSGVAPNLTGLAVASGVLTVGSAGTDLDAIAAAFAAIRVGAAHCDPDVVVMHPNDWYSAGFLLAKETTGGYLVGSPVTSVKPMLWGVPVILSEYMTENTALVANLKIAATAYVRQPPVMEVAPYGGGSTEFIANQTLVRAEERLALAVHHPAAICLVTAV
jgi:HK97 family phage major capsid protein